MNLDLEIEFKTPENYFRLKENDILQRGDLIAGLFSKKWLQIDSSLEGKKPFTGKVFIRKKQ